MTTPTPPTYYNDYLDASSFRQPLGRCPRVLDIYFSGPAGCGYIYTPTLYRNTTTVNGGTLSIMISAQTGIDITKTGTTGIMVAYKLALSGNDFNAGSTFYNSTSIGLTADNSRGFTLGRGMALAVGVSFGTGVTNNTAYTFYIVNQTAGGNSGELVWRMQYVTNSSATGWYQHGPHESNWPVNFSNSDNLSPQIAYSYGATYDGSGKSGYSGAHPTLVPLGSNNFPGSAQYKARKIEPIL